VSRLLVPNTTQVPNVLIDEVMLKLPPSAFRVLLVIVRKTYGFQKLADRISFSQLQTLTGLSREGVSNGVKALKQLVKIKSGGKGRGANEYSLNLDISTGQLVRISDQSEKLTSQSSAEKVVRISDSPKPILQNQLRAPKIRTSKPSRKQPPVEGFKESMKLYYDLFVAKVGAPPDIDGREGKILSGLLRGHGAKEVQRLLKFFFKNPPAWVVEKGKYTIPTFKGLYSELLAQSRRQQSSMEEIG